MLIDTSASMRRAGMWGQAISEAKSVINDISKADRLCVMSFDQNTKTLIGFEQWLELDPAQGIPVVTEQISKLSPNWTKTDLGNALVNAAEVIEDDQINDSGQNNTLSQVVLISDLQKGSDLEALNAYEWPEKTELVVKLVHCSGNTNAALQLVNDQGESGKPTDEGNAVVRIINSSDATTERFQLNWADEIAEPNSQYNKDVYVPAGHSSVARVPVQPDQVKARKLILTGDDHDFDNTLFLAPFLQQQVNILYIGIDNPSDPKEMLFYLQRAFGTTSTLKPQVISNSGNKTIPSAEFKTAHLIIVADKINSENLASLRQYIQTGGTLLMVMKAVDDVKTLTDLSGVETIESEEADVDKYAMLGRIEFKHPLFIPFSEPRFGDFTQIHFWKHRRINSEDWSNAQVLANFDSGDPALIELPIGKGLLLILTSGWHPSDSQLALSSKFIPLLYSILEYGGVLAGQQSQYFVGDDITMPHSIMAASANIQIRKPDNSLVNLDNGQDVFKQTDMPGIYTIEASAGNHQFAVNVPVQECQTTPMQIEDIERFGVSFKQTSNTTVEQNIQANRKLSFATLENEQKVWRWVLIILLVVSLIEIWLAGWLIHSPSKMKGDKND